MTARVVLPNETGFWRPGLFVSGAVTVAQTDVPLAVRRTALQTFRDWTVVFQKFGDSYEIRPVTLGRRDATWAEVLDGLAPGAEYVSINSFVIKADIEKSGAKHDH
jgi:cobalt-zinc-cadmium efflux system membrane fusion protein